MELLLIINTTVVLVVLLSFLISQSVSQSCTIVPLSAKSSRSPQSTPQRGGVLLAAVPIPPPEAVGEVTLASPWLRARNR